MGTDAGMGTADETADGSLPSIPFPNRLLVAVQVVLMSDRELNAYECSNPRALESDDGESDDEGPWDPDADDLFTDPPSKPAVNPAKKIVKAPTATPVVHPNPSSDEEASDRCVCLQRLRVQDLPLCSFAHQIRGANDAYPTMGIFGEDLQRLPRARRGSAVVPNPASVGLGSCCEEHAGLGLLEAPSENIFEQGRR